MNKTIKLIVRQAAICAMYVALTLTLQPISFGQVQFRVSEILVLLCFYDKKSMIGLIIGCFIANLFSPMLVFDITLGVLATVLSLIGIALIKNIYLGAICPVIFNGLIVGLELNLAFELPYLESALYVALGELGVMVVAVIVFKLLEKNKYIYKEVLVGNYEEKLEKFENSENIEEDK